MRRRTRLPDETCQRQWQRLKSEAMPTQPQDGLSFLQTAVEIMRDWSSNPDSMRAILAAGVECGELPASALPSWDSWFVTTATPHESSAQSRPTLKSPQPEVPHSVLHPLLRPIAERITRYSQHGSRDAVLLGRELQQARLTCQRHGLHFEFFLRHLSSALSLHRGSCYLYLKCADADLPPGLGVAIMKWLVQGFALDGELIRTAARRALHEQLTLSQLEALYGTLRRPTSGRAERAPTESSGERTEQEAMLTTELQDLAAREHQLMAQRSDIDQALRGLRRELRKKQALLNGLRRNKN